MKPVGPTDTTLPAVEKPAEAPDQVNDIQPGTAQTADRRRREKKKKTEGRPGRGVLEQEEKEEGAGQAESVLALRSISNRKGRIPGCGSLLLRVAGARSAASGELALEIC